MTIRTVDGQQFTHFVHKYEVGLCYGGPEEGGWWYDAGTPVEAWVPVGFMDEDQAYDYCRAMNEAEHERADAEEDYSYTSVLAGRSTHYAYRVEEDPVPHAYPERRPHYE